MDEAQRSYVFPDGTKHVVTPAELSRFTAKTKATPSGCHEWTAGKDLYGYGSFALDGRSVLAHRVAYHLFTGPLVPGLVIDHLCRNRACVNPAHLEQTSNRENILRGEGQAALNSRKTHCSNGHELTPANVTCVRGERRCRECRRAQDRARYVPAPRRADKDHCVNGHPLSGENLYVSPTTGARRCRVCRAASRRRWREQQSA